MTARPLLPPRLRVWPHGEGWIYFDPHNFAWAQVNASGRFILEKLRDYATVDEIAEAVETSFGLERPAARLAVEGFLAPLFDQGFLHAEEYQEREPLRFGQRSFAAAVYLHMTNECNLKCPYCYNKEGRGELLDLARKGLGASALSTDEYKRLISRLVELGVERLFFTGGEPLLRKDLFELIRHARGLSSKVSIEVLTNAILIREPVAQLLCDLVDAVTISLDGHERHLHEHYRGKNTFAPTVEGVRTLLRARRARNQDGPRIVLVPALTDRNIGFLKAIYQFAYEDLGVDGLAPILFQAGDHQELSLQQIPSFEAWSEASEELKDYLASRSPTSAGRRPRPLVPRNHCGVGHGEISIDPAGDVYPCQSLHYEEFRAGNVRQMDVGELFEGSPVLQRVRGVAVEALSVCRHCDVRSICHGGCRATAQSLYGRFDAHNERYCRFLEAAAVDRLAFSAPLGSHSPESGPSRGSARSL